ncbi:MAG: HAD family hydrolase [Candidatus Binataceae bacterium]
MVLDLFDTIVTWDPSGLPLLQWRGRQMRTTTPLLFPALETALGDRFDQDAFIEAHAAAYQEIFIHRASDDPREISCFERFARTLSRLGLPDREAHPLAETLRAIHMERVRGVTKAPQGRVAAVRRLGRKYRLGLLSNFDDARTGHDIMHDTGVRDLFELIVISAEHGLRKPNSKIFHDVISNLKLKPDEILFVGDTARDDVLGAKRVGMHAAWINRHAAPLPAGIPEPDLVIADLAELPELLGA